MAKSNSSLIGVLSILLILLLGLVGYQYYQIQELKADVSDTKSNLIENEKIQAELEQDYQLALNNLEDLRGTNSELNTLIDKQKDELSAQKKKVSSLIWTKGELTKAREELEVFRSQAAGYTTQIRDLSAKNANLSQANTSLNQRKTELESEIVKQTQTISELGTQREELVEVKAMIEKENTFLSDKVTLGEVVKVNVIDVIAYKLRDNKDPKETAKAKNTDYVNVCIKTEQNLVVEPGEESFQLRIISPGGETIYDESKGSGMLTNKLDNTTVKYTTTSMSPYTNAITETCVDYKPGYTLPSGNYTIEVFNKGYPVGTGNFLLK